LIQRLDKRIVIKDRKERAVSRVFCLGTMKMWWGYRWG
jgi:hypothetical protein